MVGVADVEVAEKDTACGRCAVDGEASRQSMQSEPQFLALRTISTARDTEYTKFGTSSKLIDLVISGRFHGL